MSNHHSYLLFKGYRKAKISLLTALLAIGCTLPHTASARGKEFQTNVLTLNAGYGSMTGHLAGLTLDTSPYRKELSKGFCWDVSYQVRPIQHLGIAMTYTGFSSKGSHQEGSDHLYIHYIAPQASLYCIDEELFSLSIGGGIGGVIYRNNSLVFEKPRQANGATVGLHLAVNGTAKLSKNIGLNAKIQYFGAELYKMKVNYHGETTTVKLTDDHELILSRISALIGLSYHF